MRVAAFVDRDGVINELVPDPVSGRPESPLDVPSVALIDGAAAALTRLAQDGWHLVGVSNQPAAAKGLLSVADLCDVHERVIELLAAEGVRFDDFRICLHHPDGVVADLAGPCDCRKPGPGMLLAAAAALDLSLEGSWMIGDTDSDVEAGRSAGCRTILVAHSASAHKRASTLRADATADSLAAAADIILRGGGVH
jgi:D-glycero-D-manno-heptose 1,7-bisphosphate phosphatase